jgi:hypothetical protein
VRATSFDHTVLGPFPQPEASPHLKVDGIGISGACPRPRFEVIFEGCARQPLGYIQLRQNLFRKEIQCCNEALKPSPRLTYSIFPNDCQLTAMFRLIGDYAPLLQYFMPNKPSSPSRRDDRVLISELLHSATSKTCLLEQLR